MYSYDDRIRAVRLYIQYDKSAAAVIRELGYPGRKTLRYWYEEYLRDNRLKKKSVRSPKYNGAQKGHSWQDVSIDKFIKILDDYMHWYAEERIKISLGGISPIQYQIL